MQRHLPLICALLLGCGSGKSNESGSLVPSGTESGVPSGNPTGSGTGSGTGTSTGSGTGTGTGSLPIPEGWLRVDVDGGALSASVDAGIADDGTIYVSWASDGPGGVDVLVSRSTDGGTTWEAPVSVDGAATAPTVAAGRQPYLHVSSDAVFVVFTEASPNVGVKLYRSDLGALSFAEEPLAVSGVTFVDYAKVITDAAGDPWVTWLSYDGALIWPAMARGSTNYAVTEAGSFADDPCECCRNDLLLTSAGSKILAFRGNNGTNRDMWSLRSGPSDSGFVSSVQVSRTDWQSVVCPMQGPRLAQRGDGTLIASWADPTSGSWQVWTATSTDDGLTWSGDTRAATAVGGEQRSPDLAADGDDVWIAFEATGDSKLVHSSDGGASYALLEELNSGATNIAEPHVEARNGIALVVGANSSGEVVFERLR